MDLHGKVSLVTGGTGGIGRQVCQKLAALGSFVYVCDINEDAELINSINTAYQEPRAIFVKCDLARRSEVKVTYELVAQQRGGIDILVNNAAVYGPLEARHFPDISYQDFYQTIQIDLSGALYLILLAVPYMKQQGWGRIVFTAAPLSSSGIPSPYLAGKAGFIGLTKYLSQRFGPAGIETFGLALRRVDTPMIRRVIASRGDDPEVGIKAMHSKSLTGRMISPEEVADIYAYFIAADSPPPGGTVIMADGGITYLQ